MPLAIPFAIVTHVLVHEIVHILQGASQHSATGIMKAHWSHQDYMEMSWRPLSFSEEDVQLIRFGVAARAEARTLIAAASVHQPAPVSVNSDHRQN